MPRFSWAGELIFDHEIKKIVHSANSSNPDQEDVAMANTRTLRELATPNFNQQPLCITFPNLDEETPFELKFGLIHLLPSFHDFLGEEPYKHLQEFDVVCTSMKPSGITEEQKKNASISLFPQGRGKRLVLLSTTR